MTGLQDGHRYLLSTENKNNKSVMFVKMTDSAIQSLETFFNRKNGSLFKPTIQFGNNSGIISIPLNGKRNNYEFTLSNIEGDGLTSGFQCLQHIENSSLESLGFMLMKMQIHATEDSYEKTKSKMTAADQEQKSLCTKELQRSVSRSGSKVVLKRPGMIYVPEKSHSSFARPESAKNGLKYKVTSPVNLIQQPIRERIIHILAAKTYKRAELLLRLKREGVNDKDKEQIGNILDEVTKNNGNMLVLENHAWDEVQDDWKFCSKEELQLIARKKKQFLKPMHVNGVAHLSKVNQVCWKASNGNHIGQHESRTSNLLTCSAVPVYKQTEYKNVPKQDIKELNNCLETNINGSSNTEHFLKPKYVNGEGSLPKSSFNKVCWKASNGNGVGQHKSITSNAMSNSKQTENSNVSKDKVKESNNYLENGINGCGNSESLSVSKKIKLSRHSSHHKNIAKGNTNGDKSPEISSDSESIPEFNFSETLLNYSKVESLEQRSQYLKDFNDEYGEYLKLQNKMKETSEKFSHLFDQLNACDKGSPKYKRFKTEIKSEYARANDNHSYAASRRRFEFLKAKLSHIRKLILQYDKDVAETM